MTLSYVFTLLLTLVSSTKASAIPDYYAIGDSRDSAFVASAAVDSNMCSTDTPWTNVTTFVLVTLSGSEFDGLEDILFQAYTNILDADPSCDGVMELLDVAVEGGFDDSTTDARINVPFEFRFRCKGYGCDTLFHAFSKGSGSGSRSTNPRQRHLDGDHSKYLEINLSGLSTPRLRQTGSSSLSSSPRKPLSQPVKGEGSTHYMSPSIWNQNRRTLSKKTNKHQRVRRSKMFKFSPPETVVPVPTISPSSAPSPPPTSTPTTQPSTTPSPTHERYCGCKLPEAKEVRDEFVRIEDTQTFQIEKFTPLDPIDCAVPNSTLDTFTATIVLLIEVDDTNGTVTVPTDDIDFLGLAALEAYNQENIYNPDVCDDSFREVTSVSVMVSSTYDPTLVARRNRRRLGKSNYYYVYISFDGTCRGCSGPVLEDDVSSRRELQLQDLSLEEDHSIYAKNVEQKINNHPTTYDLPRWLSFNNEPGEDDGICFCPLGVTEFLRPDRRGYRTRLRASVRDGNGDTVINNVEELLEVEERDCPVNRTAQTFSIGMAVVSSLDGTISPDDDVPTVIANVLESTYNLESLQHCDERLRSIVAVTVANAPTNDPLAGVDLSGLRADYYTITVQFFGDDAADSISGLFSDDRRKLWTQADITATTRSRGSSKGSIIPAFHMVRDLQQQRDVCYCGSGASNDPVDEVSFLEAFSFAVGALEINALLGIDSFVEYTI